jgi:DNA modification methylase
VGERVKPYYEHGGITIYHGDCREVLPTIAPESVTLLWTDPPYGHGNMDGDLQSRRVGVKGARQRRAEPEQAAKKLAELENAHPAVIAHWRELASSVAATEGGHDGE